MEIMPPPPFKFLATPLPSLVVDKENLVIGFGPPHFRNAFAIAVCGHLDHYQAVNSVNAHLLMIQTVDTLVIRLG